MADTFSPLAFPEGRIIYNFSISESPTLSIDCFPFELNREPQVVLYLADGSEVIIPDNQSELAKKGDSEPSPRESHDESPNASMFALLEDEVRASRPRYRRAILHQLLVFEFSLTSEMLPVPTDAILVPAPQNSRTTTVKTVMCDISGRLLRSMDNLAGEIQNLSTIESPSFAPFSGSKATDLASRVHARMSTPAQPNQGPLDTVSSRVSAIIGSRSRSTTPAGARSASKHSVGSPSRNDRFSEVSSAFGSRDTSQDRNSVVPSRVTTPIERKKNNSVGRSRIVVGAILLQAGLWPDALKELSEGTATAQGNNDYVWHAKGLEFIVTCLLMFGWAKMYFQIPHICYPIAEKPTIPKSSVVTPISSNVELAPYGRSSSDSRTVSLHYLTKLLPDLLSSVNTLYTRASNSTQEPLPQLLMSESILRSGYLFSAMYLRHGVIDDNMLQALLLSKIIPRADPTSRSTDIVSLKKSDIATMILHAIPAVPESVPFSELLQILIGLASILSMVGMERKQGFILKEILQRITPALIEARKVGAAEMGIHPAAGLLALSNTSHSGSLRIEDGMKSLLTLVGEMYGALDHNEDMESLHGSQDSSKASLLSSRRAKLHAYGSFDLKVDILKSCIAISEVLPDFDGVLKYTVDLLQISRRTITLPFRQPTGTPAISQEEQMRLMDSIKRTVGAAAKIGLKSVEADYWDDFLVRGIEAISPPATFRVAPHSENDLQSVSESKHTTKQDPFIYNPFSKPISSTTDQPLVAEELAYFSVYLQNPYEFDVEIEKIILVAEGCGFQPSTHSIVLGHFCCQRFMLAGKPRTSGNLKIIGCRAKIRYCKERDFLIYKADWAPKLDIKAKKIGSVLRDSLRSRTLSSAGEMTQKEAGRSNTGPQSDTISLTVISPQPFISIQSTTLSQPALMILEGEKKSFDVVLRNESNTTAVDVVLFTFEDSATTQLRTAVMNKELPPTEAYELQLQLIASHPFKYIPSGEREGPALPAGGSATFTIEVHGIPGLLNGIVQVDYAHLGVKSSDVKDKFYTRQLSFPVAVTVNAGIEVPRCNMLAFSGDFAWWNKQQAFGSSSQALDRPGVLANGLRSRSISFLPLQTDGGQFTSLPARLGLGSHGDDHCILLLDLRNVWPFPLSVSVQVRENRNASSSSTDPWRRAYTVHESVQPGHVSRAVLLIPRVYVSDPHKPIPLIGNQRQFVVSVSKLSVAAEQANREAFWYREEVLKHVRSTWCEDSTGREGSIDLRRGIRLNAKMIDVLRIEDIELSLSIRPSRPPDAQLSPVLQQGCSRFCLQVNSFATLTVKVHNRSLEKVHLLLRIQPSLRDQPHTIALDLSKRFAWTGMLQRVLHPPLAANEVREMSLGIMALCAGNYEIAATIEELKAPAQSPVGKTMGIGSQSNDRRIWHARESCLIDAVESIEP